MTTASDSDTIPQTGFDPVAFWYAHKTKVIVYGAALLIAALGFAYYEIHRQSVLDNARAAFAQAASEDDYRQVIQNYPGTIAAGNASLLLAEKLRDAKKYDESISVLQNMIDHQPSHPMIDGAWLSLAATYNAQGKPDQARDTYTQIASKFADRYSAPLALFSIAEIFSAQGKLDDAKTAYENVKSQFPDSVFASEALAKLQSLKK